MQAQTANGEPATPEGLDSVVLIIIACILAVIVCLLIVCLVRVCRRGTPAGKDGQVVVVKPAADNTYTHGGFVASAAADTHTHGSFVASASSDTTADVSGVDLFEMDKGLELSAIAREQPSGSGEPLGGSKLARRWNDESKAQDGEMTEITSV